MIYDCFQFFNEIDLLKLRLSVLDPVVDRFVISESTVTFSGHPKPLFYEENKGLFERFRAKIIHNVVRDTPDVNPFERDSFQKCAVQRGLAGATDDDVVIFSDADEIPDPVKVREVLDRFQADRVYHFAQRMFYFYLNLEEVTGNLVSFTGDFDGVRRKKWLGTKMCSRRLLGTYTLEQLRFPERKAIGVRVDDGGWHFSYMGGDRKQGVAERVADKVRFAAHQEYNTPEVLSKIANNISKQKDIFGRRSKFVRVEIDATFPDYLVRHQSEFAHLILPRPARRGILSWFS